MASSTSGKIQNPSRLDLLREAQLLEPSHGEAFDRLTRMAASLLDVPGALIYLAAEERGFYRSVFGRAGAMTGEVEGEGLLQQAMRSPTAVAIDDINAAGIVSDPLVDDFHAQASLGASLIVRGVALGSFVVVDVRPRHWSEAEIRLVGRLAQSAAGEIELRLATAAVESSREEPSKHATTSNRRRVLIAEDDAPMRRLIVRSLAEDDYEIEEAHDGRETLDILQKQPVDALVLDLIMPDLSGWDVLQKRTEDERLRKIPVIVVSGRRGPDIARAVAFGISGLLPKPFEAGDLRELVRSCLTEARAGARSAAR